MWGLPQLEWRPWPDSVPPNVLWTYAFGDRPGFVSLLGGEGPTGRYGMAGIADDIRPIPCTPGSLRQSIDDRPPDVLRVLALSYELGLVSSGVRLPPPIWQRTPAGWALDIRRAVVVDHHDRTFATVGAAPTLRTPNELPPPVERPAGLVPLVNDATHARRILEIQEHIAAGDIYQANLTRRLRVQGNLRPAATLHALHRLNPVGHSAYVHLGAERLLSNSMETLLHFDPRTRTAHSYPIKGTYSEAADGSQLPMDPKERAEHVMIVDLVRNDLGRVCDPGSVAVDELMKVHGFRGVWHGVSNVRGQLKGDRSLGDLMEAVFPGGSITGAPKRRAIEILRRIEADRRGYYTGSLCMVTPDGTLSASILIRTLAQSFGAWSLGVGGGIVADSIAEKEIAETGHKAQVFREVLSTPRIPAERPHRAA